MPNFKTFTDNKDGRYFREWKGLQRRAFLFDLCGSWTWVVTDDEGNVLAGRRNWNMDAEQAAEWAIGTVEAARDPQPSFWNPESI